MLNLMGFDLTVIFSFAGWVYLLYTVIDYSGNRLFGFRIFKPRKFIKEILLINLGLVVLVLIGFIEISITGVRNLSNDYFGLFGHLSLIVLLAFRVPLLYVPLLIFFIAVSLIVLKIYQYIFKKSQRNKMVWIIGLITAVIFIGFGLGVSDYRIVLCQLKYENLGRTITSPELIGRECVKKIALENNEVEMCGKFGDPGECYYELGVKLNDKSFCDKIEKESEYKFYASGCYAKVALSTKDSFLCKKINNRMSIRRCFIETANLSAVTKNAIEKGKPQLCVQGKNQEEMDKCYYNFVKFYYDSSDLYMDLDCYPQSYVDPKCLYDHEYCNYEKKIECYDFFAKNPRSEEGRKYTEESFIELCDSIENRDLSSECYKFKKVDISTYDRSVQVRTIFP